MAMAGSGRLRSCRRFIEVTFQLRLRPSTSATPSLPANVSKLSRRSPPCVHWPRNPPLCKARIIPNGSGLSRVGFFQTNMGSGLVPVGAGVVMGWVGTLVVALVVCHHRTKGDRKGQYRSNKKNVSKEAVFEMEALIGGALVTEMRGVLEDAR